jgi:hypothetical protein
VPSLFVVPDVSLTAIVGLGKEFTVTEAEAAAKQAVVALVIVTVYVVVLIGFTTLLFVVPPTGAAQA